MMETGKEKKNMIYAIKFIDLPFPEIDKYVCVPLSWIVHRLEDEKALVAYPDNEDPFVTRNRTKNREKHCSEWRFYIGYIKFESENYEDVIQWIEEMLANGADNQEGLGTKNSPAEPEGSKQLRSSKNPLLSVISSDKPQLTVKPYENLEGPLPKLVIRRLPPLRPWKPNQIEPAVCSLNTPSKDKPVILENRVIQNDVNHESTNDHSQPKPDDTTTQSPTPLPNEREQPPVQDELLPSPSVPDSDTDSVVVIEVEVESEPKTSEQAQPNLVNQRRDSVSHHDYSLLQSCLHEILTGQKEAIDTKTSLAQNPTATPHSRANQPPQHDYAQPSVSTLCLKQQQGTVGTSSELTWKTLPSTTYNTPSPVNISSQQQIPAVRRKSSSVIKKPVGKKPRVGNTTRNIPTSQQSLYNKQLRNYAGNGDMVEHRCPLQTMNKSAAQNLSQLAHQARFYEHSQLEYLNQMAQLQEMINRPSKPHIDQRTHLPNAMAGGYVSQNQLNQINQSSQYLPQNQWSMVNTNQMPELMGHELADQNQQARNLENPQRQYPRATKSLETQSNAANPMPRVTEVRSLSLPKTNQPISNDRKNKSRKDLLAKLSLGPVKHLEICGADSETQTTFESQETQSKQVPIKIIYQHPESRKMVADQATEMDETVASPLEPMDCGYGTHAHLRKEQESPQEVPDSLDNVSTDGSDYANEDYREDDLSARIADERSIDVHDLVPETQKKLSKAEEQEMLEVHGLLLTKMYKNFLNTEEFYNNLRNTTLGCLKLYETLLNKAEKVTDKESRPIPTSNETEIPQVAQETLVQASEQKSYGDHNSSRAKNSPTKSKQKHTFVQPAVQASVQKSNSDHNNSTAKNSQTKSKQKHTFVQPPVQASEQNSNDDHNNSSAKNSPTKSKRRHTFVLPPEYDPNDSRWTLKHRKPGPGLMELMPQSRVYVSKAEYKKTIRSSNNCRTLARLLLTAVFSKNALSVCSPTGAKARAFNTVEIDIRPGLDENARMVLLAFIEEYGKERNWNTSDTAGIMSSIRTKIQEMRNKYGKTKVI